MGAGKMKRDVCRLVIVLTACSSSVVSVKRADIVKSFNTISTAIKCHPCVRVSIH